MDEAIRQSGAAARVSLLAHLLIWLVRLYQATLRPLFGGHCRFRPTCSDYAIEALRTHGGVRGAWLTVRRLARCQPFGGAGYDPVPPRQDQR
jgi:putative membrane protein insertion efficiency factor